MRAPLDDYIPEPDAIERHAVIVRASAAAVHDALWQADLGGPVARVRCADAAARRAFGRYWRVVRPGSGLLRHVMLRRIRAWAERQPAAAQAR